MATRRILLALIGLLSACILIGGTAVAALAFFGLRNRGGELVIVGADRRLLLVDRGGRERVLAEDASPDLFTYPTLAPDGERIAYVSQDIDGFALRSMDLRTGSQIELYRSSENPPFYAAWSPDGANISFIASRGAGGLDVHVVAADGSCEADLLGSAPGSSYFAWQPGGGRLLLHIGGSSFEDGRMAAYEAGSTTPLYELADPGFFQAPAWTADGSGFFYAYRWRSDESWDTIPYSNHPYAYALSNPVNWADPTGKYCQLPDGTPCPQPAAEALRCGQLGQPACPPPGATPTPTSSTPNKTGEMLLGAGLALAGRPVHPVVWVAAACLTVAGLAVNAGSVAVQTRPQTDYVVMPMELVVAQPPTATPIPVVVPTPPRQRNRAVVQIQGHDLTRNNSGAVRDTSPTSGRWMLSFSWDTDQPISAREARQRLAELWRSLTPEQQHRRDRAYYAAIRWINESLSHSPPGRRAGEHFSFQNPPGDLDGYATARVDVAVFEGVAFNVP